MLGGGGRDAVIKVATAMTGTPFSSNVSPTIGTAVGTKFGFRGEVSDCSAEAEVAVDDSNASLSSSLSMLDEK